MIPTITHRTQSCFTTSGNGNKTKEQTIIKTKTYEKTHWVGRRKGSEAGNSKESKGGLTMSKKSYNKVRDEDQDIFGEEENNSAYLHFDVDRYV